MVCRVQTAAPVQRRCRRKRNCIYDNEQIARAFVYDLLFSHRRVAYEHNRYVTCIDVTRRSALRHVRGRLEPGNRCTCKIDIFVNSHSRLRSMAYLQRFCTNEQRQALCRKYAHRVCGYGPCSSHVGSAITFESVVSACST